MIKRLELSIDHLKLLNLIRFTEDEDGTKIYIDKVNPYILSGKLEDIAYALGMKDKIIPGTEDDAEGAAFSEEDEDYMLSIHHYIVDNLIDIEELIHQMTFKGGITPGTYKCSDIDSMWEKEK